MCNNVKACNLHVGKIIYLVHLQGNCWKTFFWTKIIIIAVSDVPHNVHTHTSHHRTDDLLTHLLSTNSAQLTNNVLLLWPPTHPSIHQTAPPLHSTPKLCTTSWPGSSTWLDPNHPTTRVNVQRRERSALRDCPPLPATSTTGSYQPSLVSRGHGYILVDTIR